METWLEVKIIFLQQFIANEVENFLFRPQFVGFFVCVLMYVCENAEIVEVVKYFHHNSSWCSASQWFISGGFVTIIMYIDPVCVWCYDKPWNWEFGTNWSRKLDINKKEG